MKTIVVVVAILLSASTTLAQDRAAALASPRPPSTTPSEAPTETAPSSGGGHEWSFDLAAGTMLPLAVGGGLILGMPGGISARVWGGVVPSAYVDGMNDIGAAFGLWGEPTSDALTRVLQDSIVLEAGLGIQPGHAPLELVVSYVLFWSEGAAPALAGLSNADLSISVYALHVELGLCTPVGDLFVFRLALGWLHGLGRSVSVGMGEPGHEEVAATMEQIVDGWVATYGLGPTLSSSLALHFD